VIHRHIVQRISFIARDVSDARAFGYVYGCRDGRHQFYGIKTEKVVCRLLFSIQELTDHVHSLLCFGSSCVTSVMPGQSSLCRLGTKVLFWMSDIY